MMLRKPTSNISVQMVSGLSKEPGAIWPGQRSRYSDLLRAGRSGGRIPVGSRFSSPVQTDPGAHPASYTMDTGSFPGVKRPGRGDDHPPHLAPRLKKEQSYTSTPSLGLRGLSQGELYLYLYPVPLEVAGPVTAFKFSVQHFLYFVTCEAVTKVKHCVVLGRDSLWFGQIYRLFGGMDCLHLWVSNQTYATSCHRTQYSSQSLIALSLWVWIFQPPWGQLLRLYGTAVGFRCHVCSRGELSYLAPLGSENISAPYFKQCFFQVGLLPPRLSQTAGLPVPRQK